MDAQAIANLIAAAVQQAAQAAGQAAGQAAAQQAQAAAAPPPPVIQFARSPALAQPALLDYSTAAGAKIFSKATESLPTTFSLSAPNIKVFLNELTTQQQTFGWESIMRVNIAPAGEPDVFCNLIEQHGRVSYENVVRHANTFIAANNRDAQNDFQLFNCLNATVDEDAKKRLANDKDKYCIGADDTPCGIAYLKLTLTKAEVDTRATAAHVRTNLTMLDTYMIEVAQQDVITFNEYVNEQMSTLTSRGEASDDILVNLFKGYEACTDTTFLKYINNLKDNWEEGSDLTYRTLMQKAEVKYAARKQENKWNEPTREQTEIIALRAQLQAKIDTVAKKRSKKSTTTDGGQKKSDGGQKKSAKFTGKMSFRNKHPNPGDPLIHSVDGDEWKYCVHHKKWGRHSSDECRMNPPSDSNHNSNTGNLDANLASIDEYDSDDEQE